MVNGEITASLILESLSVLINNDQWNFNERLTDGYIAVCSDKEHVHAETVMFNNDICSKRGCSLNAFSDIKLRAV